MKIGRIIKITGILIITLLLISAVAIYATFHREIKALSSLEQIDNKGIFTMEYSGDYGLDEFLKQGASSDADVVEFVSKYLLKGIPLQFDPPNFGCSTFAAKTPEGDYIFGRNFDFTPTPVLILKTYPKNGYASVSTVDLAFIGFSEDNLPTNSEIYNKVMILAAPYAPMDGINEKGLSIAVLQIFDEPANQKTEKSDITTSTAIRMVLDKAATTSEAVALLKQYDMHASAGSNYHFQIADATGNTAVVEYINNKLIVLDLTCATNFLLAPGQWNDKGDGYDRHEIITCTLNDTKNTLTENLAMDLLQKVSLDDTQWSVVFNNTKLSAVYCIQKDYNSTYSFSINN